MRQKGDQQFAEILNRIREGKHTHLDIKCIKQQEITTNHPDYDKAAPHIFILREFVKQHNDSVLSLNTSHIIVKARDVIMGDHMPLVK